MVRLGADVHIGIGMKRLIGLRRQAPDTLPGDMHGLEAKTYGRQAPRGYASHVSQQHRRDTQCRDYRQQHSQRERARDTQQHSGEVL